MKIVYTSDFHGYLPEIPECDLLLIGGDVTPVWNHERGFQIDWLRNEFSNWLMSVPADVIVGVGGNHDFAFAPVYSDKRSVGYELPWSYLYNEAITLPGQKPLKIWGSPMSTRFMDWAFMDSENNLSELWHTIPRDIDVLITHGPPYGIGDLVGQQYRRVGVDPHVGSTSLMHQLTYDEWPNLKLHLFGHIHEGYGEYTFKDILLVNGAHVDGSYDPVNDPGEVEL